MFFFSNILTEAKRICDIRNSRYTGIKTQQSTSTGDARQLYTQTVKKVQPITRNAVHSHPTVQTSKQVAAMFKPSTSLAIQSDSACQTSTMVKQNTSAAIQSATVGSGHARLKCNPRRSSTKHIDGSRCNSTKQLDLALLLSQIKWVGNTSGGDGSTSGLDVNTGKVPNSNLWGCTKVGVGHSRKRLAFDDLDQQPAAKYRETNHL